MTMTNETDTPRISPPEPNHEDPPAVPAQTPEEMKQARLQACFDELKDLLERHRCFLSPGWEEPKPVGNDGVTFQLSANWSLRMLPDAPGPVQVKG